MTLTQATVTSVCESRSPSRLSIRGFGRFNDDVGVDVTVRTTIECPLETLAAFAGDPTNAPRWYANIRSVDWQTPPPVAVGSRMDFVAQFLGRQLSYTYEVVELEPTRRLVMRTADGPFPMETT
ncbi:hypothetical protein GCM10027053_06100 [Intrasporangium mesophilum]